MPAAARCRTGDSCMKSSASGASLLLTAAVMVTVALACLPRRGQRPKRSAPARGADGRLRDRVTRQRTAGSCPESGSVTGLRDVRDNGKPQPLTVFSRGGSNPSRSSPCWIGGGSMRRNVGRRLEKAAEEFVRRLGPEDQARIGTFAERIQIQPEGFTNDQRRRCSRSLPVRSVRSPGRLPLWNAVDEAITALRGQEGRETIVLVFSDGGDAPNAGFKKPLSIADVMRSAQQEDVMVCTQESACRRPFSRARGGGWDRRPGRRHDIAAARPWSGHDCRRRRRRLLRADASGRSGLHVRPRRGRTAPAVCARLRIRPGWTTRCTSSTSA